MTGRPITRVGDTTTHGGTVLEGFSSYDLLGRFAAGIGHLVACPQCKGNFPIIEGVASFTVENTPVAVQGMRTACGAELIASQDFAVLNPGPGGIVQARIDAGLVTHQLAGTPTRSAPALFANTQPATCVHPDSASPLARYMVREMKTNPFSTEGRKIAAANAVDPRAQLREWQLLPWYARLGQPPDFYGTAAGQKAAAYVMWAERVAPGRPWDHKPILKNMLGGQFNDGWQKYGSFDYFYDIWSNIHYGYVGAAVGFSAAELLNGAGLAQAVDDYWRDRPKQHHPQNGPWPASADDLPDHISIKLGTDLFEAVKPHALTVGILLHRLAAVPLPWGQGDHHAKEQHKCDRPLKRKQ